MAICNRCGIETDLFYKVNDNLILCADCSTLSVSQLALEDLIEMGETETFELSDGDVIVGEGVVCEDEAVDLDSVAAELNGVTAVDGEYTPEEENYET